MIDSRRSRRAPEEGGAPSGRSSTHDRSRAPRALVEIHTLGELVELVGRRRGLYVRWSRGPEDDAHERSCDHASGLELPGLAANPLDPPRWWTLPADAWVARQVTAYDHLGRDQPDHIAWVLNGRVVDRGPDNEPLVVDVRPVACLAPTVLAEAAERAPRSDRRCDDDSWKG